MAEVLVATALVTVGLLAVITGFQYATSGVATGGGETAAVFLAEQRIEQLRAEAMRDFSAPDLAAGTMTDYCVAGHVGGGAPFASPRGLRGPLIREARRLRTSPPSRVARRRPCHASRSRFA